VNLARQREAEHAPRSALAPVGGRAQQLCPSVSGAGGSLADGGCSSDAEPGGVDVAHAGRRYLLRRLSETDVAPPDSGGGAGLLAPDTATSSIQWWSKPILDSLADNIDSSRATRRFNVHSVCSGVGAELFAIKALGIQTARVPVCDIKKHARDFMSQNHGDLISSCSESMAAYVGAVAGRPPPDCLVGGPPCQPYTEARSGRFSDDQGPATHHLYDAIFGMDGETPGGSYFECLNRTRPLGAIMEQVRGFTRKARAADQSEFERFRSMLEREIRVPDGESSKPHFTAVKAFIVNANTWLEMDRPRVMVIVLSDALGGWDGMGEIESMMSEVLSCRSKFPPHSVSELFRHWSRPQADGHVIQEALAAEEAKSERLGMWKQWQIDSLRTRAKFELPPHMTGALLSAGISTVGVPRPGARIRDVLEVAWCSRPPSERTVDNFFCDCNQSVYREPWGALKTLITSSFLFDFARGSILSGRDHFLLQALPSTMQLGTLSESKQRELAGEGIFVPCLATVLLAYYLNPKAPWIQRREDLATWVPAHEDPLPKRRKVIGGPSSC